MGAADSRRGATTSGREAPLSPEACAETLGVSRETMDRLEAHVALLRRWQPRRNLVGPATMADVWRRHVLDSGQLAAHVPPGAGRLVDLGSGAGFPGLVLAILTGIETDLVEADAAKAAFLAEAARATAAPARVHRARIERLAPWRADVVTARALAPLPALLGHAAAFFGTGSAESARGLFPKGARWRDELTESSKMWHMSVETAPSLTDSAARILIVSNLRRAQPPENRR